MEYMGNQKYWDDKFAKRGDRRLHPEKSLVDHLPYFKKGSVLDLACGDGRNTLFLLEHHFNVTGVDFSREALNRLEKFAHANHYSVHTQQIDLGDPDSLKDIGVFDNIVINHFRLNKAQLAAIDEHLSAGGILFVCGFGHKHKEEDSVRQEDLIQPTDFDGLQKSMTLLTYTETEDDNGFFVTYLFSKN
ncbi:class I SAM-dependent methyltransferase [Paenibacillus sp. VCA1]|uniref:class I SAM-dependent methyltransferase n=1 Tax=Paenibacillus sp. VCA1 TaxID=3039148 RepID=UPI002871272C|nr:class I SAM-dependent methyltransferase [Paenibacillus sp. VCA1]MDR9854334.1 class I SAM-dependent methyltransferase [Paenibacillus sp. VCA1]